MAYNNFTIPKLLNEFGLSISDRTRLFTTRRTAAAPATLIALLQRYSDLASKLSTEKAKSELVIAPVLVELALQLGEKISLFSGIDFSVDEKVGLSGRCDFIVSRSPLQLALTKPVCMLVEAKREDIVAGVPQCLAEMVAAQRFNGDTETVYGVVTSGMHWRFLQLDGTKALVDSNEYAIQQLDDIYSILTFIALGE